MNQLMMICISNILVMFYSSHPVIMGMALLSQTFMICLMTRFMTNSSWMPFTIFLTMVGGLMILFVYMTSVSPSKKPILFNMKILWWAILLMFLSFFFNSMKLTVSKESFQLMDNMNMEFLNLFLNKNILTSNFMFIYLLIMLIIMIEIMSLIKGPMRKKY